MKFFPISSAITFLFIHSCHQGYILCMTSYTLFWLLYEHISLVCSLHRKDTIPSCRGILKKQCNDKLISLNFKLMFWDERWWCHLSINSGKSKNRLKFLCFPGFQSHHTLRLLLLRVNYIQIHWLTIKMKRILGWKFVKCKYTYNYDVCMTERYWSRVENLYQII